MTICTPIGHWFNKLSRRALLLMLALGLGAPGWASELAVNEPGGGATPSLAGALNPDGTLRAGVTGSFDPEGYCMATARDGKPVFRPAGVKRVAGAGDESWQDGFTLAGVGGPVATVAQVGTDVYVGGSFLAAGTTAANNIAKWNGTSWSSLGAGVNGTVVAIAVSGTDVYAGGYFFSAGGVPVNNIAKWDGTAWSALGTGMNNTVMALAIASGQLHAGGRFTTADGVSASYIAKWDGIAWSSLGAGMNVEVQALAVSGSTVYAGGYFGTAGGVAANYIAKWNGATWSSLGAGMNNNVRALAVAGNGEVYAGGSFTTAGGIAANRIAKWNGSVWSALGAGADNSVQALALVGNDVYAGGSFATAGSTPVCNVAKFSSATWSSLGTGTNGAVQAIAITGTDVYVGGSFTVIGGVAANRIAKYNGSTWSALGTGLNGSVRSLAIAGTTLYVGGSFTNAGGVSANQVARWNGSAWSAMGSGMLSGNGVNALLVVGTTVYAGGDFSSAGGVTGTASIARWTGSAWSTMGTGLNNNGANVRALAAIGTDVYAAYSLVSTYDGRTYYSVQRWNGTAWNNVGAAGMDGTVTSLAVMGADLYAGGYFSSVGGVVAYGLAKWNGTAWSGLYIAYSYSYEGVGTLAVAGNNLYVGGQFTSSRKNVARWNGTVWSALGTGLNDYVSALAVGSTGKVYASGGFTAVGDGSKVSAYFGVYTIPSAPTITSFTPNSGSAGTSVAITGTNLAGATRVLFGLVDAPTFTVNSATSITVTVPAGVTAAPLSVTNADGTATSLAYFEPPAPCIATVSVTPAGPVTLPSGGSAQLTATATAPELVTTGYGIYGDLSTLLVQPGDGKILVGGGFADYNGQGQGRLNRLQPDGTRDPGFGGNLFSGFTQNTSVLGLVLQPDGKIVAGGTFTDYNGTARNSVARLNADGTLDATFAPTGTGFNGEVSALVRQPDGKILVGGRFTSYNGVARAYVARLNADGTLDASFVPAGTGFNFWVNALALQPDGKILAGGAFATYNGLAASRLVRLNADGSRDASFTQTGTGLSGAVNALALQPDGKVLAGGGFGQYNGLSRGSIARFNVDGTLDAAFVPTGTGFNQSVYALTVQRDGQVLAGGYFDQFNGTAARYMARLNSNGSRDASFATTGSGLSFGVFAIVEQADGKLVIGGNFSSYNGFSQRGIARLNRNGTLNNTATVVPGATFTWSPGGSTSNPLTVTQGGSYTATYGSCPAVSNTVVVTVPAPVLSSLAPASGPAGSVFDLSGTNLSGATAVTFTSGGVATPASAGFVVASNTSITGATVPVGLAPGACTVTVTTPGGTSNGLTFTVQPGPPTLTAVAPAFGGLGQSIALTGTNLGSPTALSINGTVVPVASILSNTGSSLVVRVPVAAAASGNVSLTTATGTAVLPFALMPPPGNALAFDGADDYVALPLSTPVPVGNSQYTIEAWIKPTSMGVYGIIGWGDYVTANQVNALCLSPNGIINYWWGADLIVNTPDLSGRWHHVAATFDGTTRKIYLDGAVVGFDTPGGHAVPDARNLRIGSTNTSASGEYFSGSIDEVRVYSTALTQVQLRADMVSTAAAEPASLVLYYNMDQGTPATASAGNNVDLTTLYDLAAATPGTLTNFVMTSGSTASNYVQSFAMVVPVATTSTARSATGFTANWTAPTVGTATSYFLDVSTTATFATPIAGSPFAVAAPTTSHALTGLNPSSTYFYRVRALNSALTVPDQGAFSNVLGQATPLPVELTAFTATVEGNAAVLLTWATASEKNSARFEVERSANGVAFDRIGAVAAAGSSSAPRAYELLDTRLPAGTATLYYRLRQVDTDNTFSYSPVRTVALTGAAAGPALYPNPAVDGTATLTGAGPGAVVTVFDALGRRVTTAPANATGTAVLVLPQGLPSGVYVVRSGAHALRLTVQ